MKKPIVILLAAALLACPLASCTPLPPSQSSTESSTSWGIPPLPDGAEAPRVEPLGVANPSLGNPAAGVAQNFPDSSSVKGLTPYDCQIFVLDKEKNTVSDFTTQETKIKFATLVNKAVKNPPVSAPSGKAEASFMVMLGDYVKISYSLVGGSLLVNNTSYKMSAKDYAALKALAKADTCTPSPYWLIYMNPNRVTQVRYNLSAKAGEQKMPADSGWPGYVYDIRALNVTAGSGTRYTPTKEKFTYSQGKFQTKLVFDNDIVYTLTFDKSTLYLTSSDMKYGWKYTLNDPEQVDYLKQYAKDGTPPPPAEDGEAMNVATGKPVIYLYPEKTQEVRVELDFKGQLTYTFPTYNDGWQVKAQPDGTLTNLSDGSTHYYLFWEGNPDRREWDLSTGFVVKGSETEAFFREKLPKLGLTPREYNDFITYWTPELNRNPYNLINFSTTEYQAVAPLTVTPAPDTVLRVHMVFKGLSTPIGVEEQILPPPPPRDGFTVVEWGGTRAK